MFLQIHILVSVYFVCVLLYIYFPVCKFHLRGTLVCMLTPYYFAIRFLPETLRALVGDGHITPSRWYRPLIPLLGRSREHSSSNERPPKKPFANPLRLLTQPDIILVLLYNGILFSAFYCIMASLSTLFKQAYALSETNIGLCFLALAGGMLLGGVITGKLLDRDHLRIKNKLIMEAEAIPEKGMSPLEITDESNFPIEKARLRTSPIYLAVSVASCIGYGWTMHRKVHIAVPLLLHFICKLHRSLAVLTLKTFNSRLLVGCNNEHDTDVDRGLGPVAGFGCNSMRKRTLYSFI